MRAGALVVRDEGWSVGGERRRISGSQGCMSDGVMGGWIDGAMDDGRWVVSEVGWANGCG